MPTTLNSSKPTQFPNGVGPLIPGFANGHKTTCFPVAILFFLISSSFTGKTFGNVQRFEQMEVHMGTEFKIILFAKSQLQADRAFKTAFQRIADLDERLSNYKKNSEINLLCASAPHSQSVKVSKELIEVLACSRSLYQLSDGAFDVTVGPITKLWRRARRQQRLPAESRIRIALQSVGMHHVDIDVHDSTVKLAQEKMLLDLGGIAKGYAIDKTLQSLTDQGIRRALVDGGGDVAVSSAPPDRKSWSVGIWDPIQKKTLCLQLVNQAVATSGDRFQFVEIDGKRYSHIVNPQTGIGISFNVAVTVIAPNATWADGLASAGAVSGSEKGIEFLKSQDDCDGMWFERFNEQVTSDRTPGFTKYITPCQKIP